MGASMYIEPLIDKLIFNKINVYLYLSDIVLDKRKSFLKKSINVNIVENIHELEIKKFSCVVASATGKKIENLITEKALKLNIPCIQFVDNIYGWKNRITYKKRTIYPTNFLVINKQCYNLAKKDGIPENSIKISGHPAWESIKNVYFRNNKNTLFIGSPINEIYKNRLGYNEKEVWDICIKASIRYPNLIYNIKYLLHPGQKKPSYVKKKFIIKNIKNNFFYGQIIGIFSSYLTEAYLQGKKVISIQPKINREDKWIISRFYKERTVKDYKQLIKALKITSKNKDYLSKDLFKSTSRFIELIRQYF